MRLPLAISLLLSSLILLAVFNVVSLFVGQAPPARAEFGQPEIPEMTWKELRKHKDFRRAVQSIVQDCKIGEDGQIEC